VAAFCAFALYLAVGVVVGLLFVIFGAAEALPHPMPVSAGARALLLPGSILLWPVVLGRWRQSKSRR
jgi:hypothetical protein